MIKVRQATFQDKPAIFSFLDQAYQRNAPYKHPERWEWEFERNPFKPNNLIPVYIAVDEDGKVVGQSAAMYEPIKIGSEIHTLAWALDAYVLPEFRGMNLGFETLKLNCETNNLWMGLIMAESSRHILTKLGCRQVEPVSVFYKLVRMDPNSLREAIYNRWKQTKLADRLLGLIMKMRLDRGICSIWNTLLDLQDSIHGLTGGKFKSIHEVQVFGKEFDELWSRLSPGFEVIMVRDSKFLKWKYLEQPFVNYRIFVAENQGRLDGYVILRVAGAPESNSGYIADLFTKPDDYATIKLLLGYSVRFFREKQVKYIFAASTLREYKKAFSSFCFKSQKEVTPLLHVQNLQPGIQDVLENGSWFLGRSDHDWDQIPYG